MQWRKGFFEFVRSGYGQSFARYSMALAMVGVFVVLKLTVLSDLSRETPFLFILLSVFVSAYYGGFWPGITATVISGVAIVYFYLPPIDTFALRYRSDVESLLIYGLVGFAVSRFIDQLKQHSADLEARVARRTAELKKANQELRRSNKELQDFASVASHDLKEPLRKILAFADRLEHACGDTLPADARLYMQRMTSSAGRMKQLIEALLVYASARSEHTVYTTVSLQEVVADVLEDMDFEIKRKKAVISVGRLHEIQANPVHIRQVIGNIVSNALKFHKSNELPKVHISSKLRYVGDTQKECVLSIADQGIGIPVEHRDRVFVIFQRLHGRSQYEGTGIGLAIVKRIVQQHGGTIKLAATKEGGTVFQLHFPLEKNKGTL